MTTRVWVWLKSHAWLVWTMLGVAVVVLARVVFHGMRHSDAVDAETARLEWARQALEAERHTLQLDTQRAELERAAVAKARERAALGHQDQEVAAATSTELERIRDMDAETLAAEWAKLRGGST